MSNEKRQAALLCARVTFRGGLTASVNRRAGASLIETIMLFTEYFSERYKESEIEKLELFLSESDMHEEKKPWQVTTFEQ